MLGLGTDIVYQSPQSAIKLVLTGLTTTDLDDENVMVAFTVTDADTQAALLSGITQATGAKVNGTLELTVTNVTADPDLVGTDTFNVFQYSNLSTAIYFISLATSNITISSGADYQAVDLTAATFLNSGGSDAGLDASGSGEIYNFASILSIPGFESSESIAISNISIDAA
tara:strand:- start:3089 stop:3601 length:513 start_codon:yes stop_codon:yes gene_type:complete